MSYSLRDLPLPVKVVVSVFLMAVGLGYTSAMLQLHMQDAKSGKPMPTVEDVIRKYTGKKWYDSAPPPPVSKFVALVTAPRSAAWGSNGTMAPAFFEKDNGEWDEVTANKPGELPQLKAEREGEQAVTELWGKADPKAREEAYAKNAFKLDEKEAPKAFTPKFKDATDGTFKIKDLIDARCARCHKKGGPTDPAKYPLQNYQQIDKYLQVSEAKPFKEGGDWVTVEAPIGIEHLTQSTHAHLLSFAMLFSLTGLVFAFSSYPTSLRCILGPWVVIAVFADVSLWWLARMCDQWGPYFAMGIIGTGAVAGLGLGAQITLSLFNMYRWKGKVLIGAFFVLGGVIAGLVWMNKIDAALKAKATPSEQVPSASGDPSKDQGSPKKNEGNGGTNGNGVIQPPPPPTEASQLERLLVHPIRFLDIYNLPVELMKFEGGDDGNMARAFFDKEKTFRTKMNDEAVPQAEKDKLFAEREGERKALVAWIRTADPARRAAYEGKDGFVLPPDLAGKPITPDYLKGGKVQIKAMIEDRCVRCHGPGAKQADFPLTNYEELSKYMNPPAPTGK